MGLFGAVKALVTSDGVVEKGAAAIDALHLSKEEEAGLNERYILAKAKLLEASGPSAITRRILALVVGSYWLLCNVSWLLVWSFAMFIGDGDLTVLRELNDHIADRVNPAFMLIMIFYFGVRALEGIKK